MAHGEVSIALDRDYTQISTFQIADYVDLK